MRTHIFMHKLTNFMINTYIGVLYEDISSFFCESYAKFM